MKKRKVDLKKAGAFFQSYMTPGIRALYGEPVVDSLEEEDWIKMFLWSNDGRTREVTKFLRERKEQLENETVS